MTECLYEKKTAIWLFQETEKVSSDRLFRVHSKQPNTSDKSVSFPRQMENTDPVKAKYIVVGELCVFNYSSENPSQFRIGKVLQFVQYQDKGKSKAYKGNYANVKGNYGVMCTWFKSNNNVYKMCKCADVNYHHIQTYICTVTKHCIVSFNFFNK